MHVWNSGWCSNYYARIFMYLIFGTAHDCWMYFNSKNILIYCMCPFVHASINICYVSHVLYRTQCVSISTHHHSELWSQQAYIGAYQYCTTHLINCARSEVHACVYTYTWLCILFIHVTCICRNYLTHMALIRNLIIVWVSWHWSCNIELFWPQLTMLCSGICIQ